MHNASRRFPGTQFRKRVISFFSPQKLSLALIGFGILVRLVQYLHNRSLWADEAVLALNIVNRSYLELLQPLDYDQGAPLGFLMVEKLAVQVFGNNEYALRLFPLLSGIASLFLFYELAKRCIQPKAIPIGLALFASLQPFVYFSSEVKQYSSDVAIALLSCLIIMQMNTKKLTLGHLAAFGIVGATAIWFSHPAIFVLAGVGTSYFIINFYKKNFLNVTKILIVYLIWILSFSLFYWISLSQLVSNENLLSSWGDHGGFPDSVFEINWLFETFIKFFTSPLGFPEIIVGVAILTFLSGCIAKYYDKKSTLLILLSPLLVTLFAAYLHKYPFSRRLVLFLTPFVVLILAEGANYICRKLRSSSAASVGILLLVLLLASPLSISSYSLIEPSLKEEIKPIMNYVKEHKKAEDTVYVYQRGEYQFKYYAKNYGFQEGDYIIGVDDLDQKDGSGLSLEESKRYIDDLDKLRGKKRVWVIFSHLTRASTDERKLIELYIDSMGKRIDAFRRKGAEVHLYDFSE